MKALTRTFLVTALLAAGGSARAATIELFDWAFNVDGITVDSLTLSGFSGYYTPAAGDLAALAATFDLSGFDFSTDPGTGGGGLGGGLGTISISLAGAGSHFVGAFFDHEITEAGNTFFNEDSAAVGAPAAGQSWELDDPFLGDIFFNLLDSADVVPGSALDNMNQAPTGADVAMAMGFEFVLATGEQAVIDLVISGITPSSGFYLSHTDPDSLMTLYLSGTLDIRAIVTPEPGTVLLLGLALAGVGAARQRRVF